MRTLVPEIVGHAPAIECSIDFAAPVTQWQGIVSNKFSTEPSLPTKPWLAHYPAKVSATLSYPDFPAWGFLANTAAMYPDRIACHYYKQHLTFAEVAEQARRVAAMLVKYGVRPGDRVGILLPNMPEYISEIGRAHV